jgi:hypothetical protein
LAGQSGLEGRPDNPGTRAKDGARTRTGQPFVFVLAGLVGIRLANKPIDKVPLPGAIEANDALYAYSGEF